MADQIPVAPPPPLCPPSVAAATKRFNTSTDTFTPIRLHFAINSNDVDAVHRLIKQGLNLNFFALGNTPLMLSLLRENFEVARALIEAGADVEVGERYKWQRRPIHLAARIGEPTLVKEIVRRCPSAVHSTDAMLFTPLHWASWSGNVDVVRYLVDEGAHVNVRDDRGRTPLHRASENARLDVARLLVDEGALVNVADIYGWTPIYQPIVCADADAVRLLLESGASVDVRDFAGLTPLHATCGRKSPYNVRILWKTSIDFYTRDFRAATPTVQKALGCCESDLPIVEQLLDFGADVNAVSGDGRTPLRVAAESGHREIVRIFVSAGADLNLETSWISAGEWPQKIADDDELCAWLREASDVRVASMAILCKHAIRRNLRTRIHEKIVELPLPHALQLFLFVTL